MNELKISRRASLSTRANDTYRHLVTWARSRRGRSRRCAGVPALRDRTPPAGRRLVSGSSPAFKPTSVDLFRRLLSPAS